MESEAPRGRKADLLALAISVLALIVSLLTAWWSNWRPVKLEVDTDSEIQVSNTLGGKAEANLTLTFWGDGSKGARVNISGAEMDIQRGNDTARVRLEATGDDLPLIVEGQSGHKAALRFAPKLYLPEMIDEYERWCRDLRDAMPAADLRIDSLRNSLVEASLPARPGSVVGGRITIVDWGFRESPRGQANVSLAADLLGQVDAIKLRRLVFLVPGQYMVTLRVKGKRSQVLWTNRYSFDIQGAYATSLQRNFSSALRVPLRPN